jgi:hypothetical protein
LYVVVDANLTEFSGSQRVDSSENDYISKRVAQGNLQWETNNWRNPLAEFWRNLFRSVIFDKEF